jgi:hypothetical protein
VVEGQIQDLQRDRHAANVGLIQHFDHRLVPKGYRARFDATGHP